MEQQLEQQLEQQEAFHSEVLHLDEFGQYDVQEGDTFWSVAERWAEQECGHKPSPFEIACAMTCLFEANKIRFPGIDCNPQMLRAGMRLSVPASRFFDATPYDDATPYGDATTPANFDDATMRGEYRRDAVLHVGATAALNKMLTSYYAHVLDAVVEPPPANDLSGHTLIIRPQPSTYKDENLSAQIDAIKRQQFEMTGVMGADLHDIPVVRRSTQARPAWHP